MNCFSWWFKLILILVVGNTMAGLEGIYLGFLGSGWVIMVGLALTSALAVIAMVRLGMFNTLARKNNLQATIGTIPTTQRNQ